VDKIDVLDHGFVRLVNHMGSDLDVVRVARNSYDAAWRAGNDEGSDAKLIRFLWNNKHSTPFETVEFQFEVKAPIFVFRQWHRHRTWTYNEVSARYTELPAEFYTPDPKTIGVQSKTNKQAREIPDDPAELERRAAYEKHRIENYVFTCREAFRQYQVYINAGWPRELARTVLPLSTYSKMFAKVDLWNLAHFLTLRLHPHAQYEIRVYAEAITQLIRPIVPTCMEVMFP
jgi:thymidylate synthase (FAD)